MTTYFCTYFVFVFLFLVNDDAKKGNEAYNNANYPLAEELYRTALEDDPDNANIYFNLGNALAKQSKNEEAIQMYLQFISMVESPEEKSQAEYNIGTLLSESQQWKPAVQYLRNALTYNPYDNEAKHNFEKALIESQKQENNKNEDKDNDDAPTEYAKAVKAQAEEFVRQKRYKEAFNLMKKASQFDQTIQNYKQFINRIGAVSDIDS